jgi:hypothetical protein
MLLHEHPANLRRIERDAVPVNSVGSGAEANCPSACRRCMERSRAWTRWSRRWRDSHARRTRARGVGPSSRRGARRRSRTCRTSIPRPCSPSGSTDPGCRAVRHLSRLEVALPDGSHLRAGARPSLALLAPGQGARVSVRTRIVRRSCEGGRGRMARHGARGRAPRAEVARRARCGQRRPALRHLLPPGELLGMEQAARLLRAP